MLRKSVVGTALAAIVVVATPAIAGPEWIEIGDAGRVIGGAQKTYGQGSLNGISGDLVIGLGAGDFEDMYLISVVNPAIFSITIANADFDAQLFIFNVTLPGDRDRCVPGRAAGTVSN